MVFGHRLLQSLVKLGFSPSENILLKIIKSFCFLCEKSFQKYSIVPKGKSVGYRVRAISIGAPQALTAAQFPNISLCRLFFTFFL